jgi:uncharacterized membrane protein YraQ (UPF0718 family)
MSTVVDFMMDGLSSTFDLLLDASPYILFGILVAGLLRMFLSTEYVATHLGRGRILPIIKAALLGVPIPLCSCGVLPAAVSLRKQGASKGATTAFLISTPESGVDSITVSWALLDPIMTIARPLSAFATAITAGLLENLIQKPEPMETEDIDRTCAVDGCCDANDCDPDEHDSHHSFQEKFYGGLRYAFGELWSDIAGWFAVGLILAGIITAAIPESAVSAVLGGGLGAMLLMLLLGVPLYICATASTPVAAALIIKGVSPGAALVFLLVGPATNIASLSVLLGLLGRRAVSIYLGSIALVSVTAGLILDGVYRTLGISASVTMGQAADIIPSAVQYLSAFILLTISVKPLYFSTRDLLEKIGVAGNRHAASGCECTSENEECQ